MKTTSPNTTIGPYFPFDFVDECSDLTTKNPKVEFAERSEEHTSELQSH